jgi:hypothetical protein
MALDICDDARPMLLPSLARASHSNHETGTDNLRPSRRSTRSQSRVHSTAAADGYLSRWVIEELIPEPQKQLAVRDDDAAQSLDLARSVASVDPKADDLSQNTTRPSLATVPSQAPMGATIRPSSTTISPPMIT